MNQIDLNHRHAVITGGAQGIGFSIAMRLLSSGASVSIWDRDEELLSTALRQLSKHGTVSTLAVDVADADSVKAANEATVKQHEKIDILVANAGIAGPNHPSWECPIDEWKRVIDVNLHGVFLCCRAIVPHMLHRNYGRIVNVASIAAGQEGNPTASASSASKAGVIAFTKSLRKETATHNIAVNCITPAARTRIFDQIMKQHIDYMLSKIPRGRFLEVEEASAMVAWPVSEDNSFTAAAVFDLSGGPGHPLVK